MDSPRLLIVTPTLGVSAHLPETVDRVVSLRLPATHVLSAPRARLAGLAAKYPDVSVVADAGKPEGLYGALNAALGAFPDGWDWFTYINDDDVLLPGFGELFRRHTGLGDPEPVAYGDVEVVREDGRRISRVTTERSPAWIPALLRQGISPLIQHGMIFHRETVRRLGGFDTRYRLCADLDFWLRAYAGGDRFRHHPLTVARFRIRGGQLSSDTARTAREQDEIVGRHLRSRIPALVMLAARWRYRACNLPRYLERFRNSGISTSYRMLARGASPSE